MPRSRSVEAQATQERSQMGDQFAIQQCDGIEHVISDKVEAAYQRGDRFAIDVLPVFSSGVRVSLPAVF